MKNHQRYNSVMGFVTNTSEANSEQLDSWFQTQTPEIQIQNIETPIWK